MKRRKALFFTALGFTIGYLFKKELDTNRKKISPEKALQYAKHFFEKNGPITGSWIYTKEERLEKDGLVFKGYRGGISRKIDGELHQFEFFAHLENGTILYVKKLDV